MLKHQYYVTIDLERKFPDLVVRNTPGDGEAAASLQEEKHKRGTHTPLWLVDSYFEL